MQNRRPPHTTRRSVLLPAAVLSAAAGLAALMLVLAPHPARAQGTIYVDADASGSYNGTSWTDAYTNVQDGLASASSGDQIWVAEGVYYPDEGTGQTDGSRSATFQLLNGVVLYGGFDPSVGDDTFGERDWETNVTVLSGDIDQNDTTDADGVVRHTGDIAGANSYHVVTGSGVNGTALLDGFTVTAGQADGSYPYERGGAMYNNNGDPTLAHIVFIGNYSDNWGGAVYNNSSDLAMTDVVFEANHAEGYPGGAMYNFVCSPAITNGVFVSNTARMGGAMGNYQSSPKLTVVTFTANVATDGSGGAMYNTDNSSPWLEDVTFTGNTAISTAFAVAGGGMYNSSGSPVLVQTTFISNAADFGGGGMYSTDGATAVLTDVTFMSNTAEYGGGMMSRGASSTLNAVTFTLNTAENGGGMCSDGSGTTTLEQVVFVDNEALGDSGGGGGGGGLYYRDGELTLYRVAFFGNRATGTWTRGGGLLVFYDAYAELVNVLFSGNSAGYNGGGMNNFIESDAVLVNVSFGGNSAGHEGGGLYNDGSNSSTAVVTNTILWGNSATSGANLRSTGGATIGSSLVGGCGGSGAGWDSGLGVDAGGNLDADPGFLDADGADNTAGTLDDNLRVVPSSPAVDAGDNAAVPAGVTIDLAGNPRIVGTAVDMGAYESYWPERVYLALVLRGF